MNAASISQLYVIAGDQLDSLWEFFVTVHLALVAALYGIERLRRLGRGEYIILAVAYAAFTIINFRAKSDAYDFLNATKNDAISVVHSDSLPHLSAFFSNISFDDRIFVLWAVHLGSAIFLAVLARRGHNLKRDEQG